MPGDYDGDGKTDVAVYRPSTGHWFILQSSTNSTTWDVHQWGTSGDVPVPGDYDGDGKTDLAVFRPLDGTLVHPAVEHELHHVERPSVGQQRGRAGAGRLRRRRQGPTSPSIRPSTGNWFILKSSTNYTTWNVHQWGSSGDVPVPGDYDGDGRTDVTVYRPSDGHWFILKSSTNSTTWDLWINWESPETCNCAPKSVIELQPP